MSMENEPGGDSSLADTRQPPIWSESSPGLCHHPLFHAVLIIIAGLAVYANTINSPFIFDDYPYLVHNPVIRKLASFSDNSRILDLGINADVKHNIILRPVTYLTFAQNYALHGLDVRGYHVTNLIIHCANALVFYLLVTLLLRTDVITERTREFRPGANSCLLPLFCAMLFVSHPLQTQAVTYIIQRFTSLAALFCLGSLVLYIYGRLSTNSPTRYACYVLSFIAAILAMKTKENAFTFPLVIVLCEFIFFTASYKKRIVLLSPFLLTMAVVPLKLMELSSLGKPTDTETIVDSIHLVNFRAVSSLDYLMTQFGVIATYLRLLVLPINQNFDYDYPLQKNLLSSDVLLPLTLLLLIIAAGTYALKRSKHCDSTDKSLYRLAGFGCFWFFITLAVESSIIPIDDLIFEHRVYLPSAGFFMSGVSGVTVAYRRLRGRTIYNSRPAIVTACLVIICLSAASIARNRVWNNRIGFWSDAASKSPNKSRVHRQLGQALFDSGRKTAGTEEFRAAVRLSPRNVHSRVILGKALLVQGRFDEAAEELLTAVRLDPSNSVARVVLGEIYEEMGRLKDAKEAYLTAIRISPSFAIAHIRLGEVHDHEGNIEDAIREYEIALKQFPDESTKNRLAELKRQHIR